MCTLFVHVIFREDYLERIVRNDDDCCYCKNKREYLRY